MLVNKKNYCHLDKVANVIGFLFSFFVFSAILYNVLSYFNKIPTDWSYFHIVLIVVVGVFFSFLIKKIING